MTFKNRKSISQHLVQKLPKSHMIWRGSHKKSLLRIYKIWFRFWFQFKTSLIIETILIRMKMAAFKKPFKSKNRECSQSKSDSIRSYSLGIAFEVLHIMRFVKNSALVVLSKKFLNFNSNFDVYFQIFHWFTAIKNQFKLL